MPAPPARWRATIAYRCAQGEQRETYDLHELWELHDLVETGPHFDTVTGISVKRINHCTSSELTIEQAEAM